jgi:hypothetical protein
MNNSLLFNKNKLKKIDYITNTDNEINVINEIPKVKDYIIDNVTKKHLYFNDNLTETNLHSINIPYNSNSEIVNEKKERINRILVDSRYRNRTPKNILDTIYYQIPINSINLLPINSDGLSNILKINMLNTNTFKINDRIIIQNLRAPKIQLKNPIIMTNNIQYIKIMHPNHQLIQEYTKYNDINLIISNVKGNSKDGKYLNNISITQFNKKHKIFLTINENEIVNQNYYYIKIDEIPKSNYIDIDNIVIIEMLNIYGVPLNMINSNYPLNDNQLTGYHTILNVTSSYIEIQLNIQISLQILNVGSKFNITKVVNTIDSYPNNNQYSITLKKTLYNISSIKLVNAYFPISGYLVKTDINDMLYWQINNDSDYLYSIKVYQNNYKPNLLENIIQEQINLTKRNTITNIYYNDNVNKKIYYNPYHISKVSINQKNNLFKIEMFEDVIIQKAIVSTEIDEEGYTHIIINYYNHNLLVNDQIEIFDSLSTNNIPANIINSKHIIEKIIDTNYFKIKLSLFNSEITQLNGGGLIFKIRKPLKFRLLFNKSNTIGNILGFRNVGNSKSITTFNTIIQNDQPYEQDFLFNEQGESILDKSQTIIPNHNILYSNINHYILITTNILESKSDGETLISGFPENIKNVLAKIDYDNDIGKYVYNTYTNFVNKLSINISQLSEIDFTIYNSDGILYDGINMDHSFVLEIIEDLNELINSKSNTRQGL